jgi:quercetin dioxygenase-like cupin family protein
MTVSRHVNTHRSAARMAFLTALFLVASHVNVSAQPPGLTTKLLLKTTYSGDATKEALVLTAELAPHGTTGRHIHPGDEYGTVLEGELEVHVEGQEPRRIKAGEAYHNPKGIVHETRNPTASTTRLLSTFIIDKGQAVVQPVK